MWKQWLTLAIALSPAACGDDTDPAPNLTSTSGTGGGGGAGVGGSGGSGGNGGVGGQATGEWRPLAPLGHGNRQENAVVALDGMVYVIGGFDSAVQVTDTVERYDPADDTWTTVASMPQVAHHANAAAVDGKLYVLGSLTDLSFAAVGDVFSYDPVADAWTPGAPMPAGTERGSAAVGVIDGKIYLAGGYRLGSVADFSVYDPAADSWASLPDLPEARDHLVGAAVGGVFYAIGGRNGGIGELRGQVDAFDPVAGTWASRAPMPTARGGAAAGVVESRIYVVGGEGKPLSATGVFDSNEAYDPAADTWTIEVPMITPRHGTGAAGVDGVLYVPGGATVQAFGAVDTNESYTP